jgi:hypothetical protein
MIVPDGECKECGYSFKAEKFMFAGDGSHLLFCRNKPGREPVYEKGKLVLPGSKYGITEKGMTCDKWRFFKKTR